MIGGFSACKKVRKDFFDKLKKAPEGALIASAAAAAVVAAAVVAAAASAAVAAAEKQDYEDKDYPDAAVIVVAEHINYLSPRKKFRSTVRRGGRITRGYPMERSSAASVIYYAGMAKQVTIGKGDHLWLTKKSI